MIACLLGLATGLSGAHAVSEPAPEPALRAELPEEASLELRASAPPPVLQDDDTILWSWKDGLRFQTVDGSVKGKLGGRLHWDASWLDIDESLGLDDADGTEFRRARIVTDLQFDAFFVKAEYDFAGTDADFTDVWIGRKDVIDGVDVKVGHMKEPFHLDYLNSANNITFVERSLAESLTLNRNTGVLASGNVGGDAANWALGVFKNADSAGTNQMDGDYAVTARVSGAPLFEDEGAELIHVGAAYSLRDGDMLRFRQRPEIHLAPFVLDTGALAVEDVSHGNVELAGVFGPAHFQAEYTAVSASGATGAEDFDATGFYGQVGWFLTGESRPYKRASGTFGRVQPRSPYGDDGCGAFEVALRYSSVDLTDGAIVGGEQNDVTLGLNWYLTPNLRVCADYVHGTVDLGPGLDGEDVDALVTRVQVDW